MAISKEDILEAVGSLTVMELNDLVKAFEEKFGVSAAAVAVAGPAGAAAVVEEQTEFTVMLNAAGDKKVEVIKVVRAVTGLASRKPRIWLMALRRQSRKVFPRLMQKPSRSNWKTQAPRSKSSNRRFASGLAALSPALLCFV